MTLTTKSNLKGNPKARRISKQVSQNAAQFGKTYRNKVRKLKRHIALNPNDEIAPRCLKILSAMPGNARVKHACGAAALASAL